MKSTEGTWPDCFKFRRILPTKVLKRNAALYHVSGDVFSGTTFKKGSDEIKQKHRNTPTRHTIKHGVWN